MLRNTFIHLPGIGPKRERALWEGGLRTKNDPMNVDSLKDGCLFGIHGRQDGPPAELRCIDPRARRVQWRQPGFGYATLIRCGQKLLILKTDGTLVLAAANPGKYEELASTRVCENTTRALPALSDGLFYVRDAKVLKCIDLRSR